MWFWYVLAAVAVYFIHCAIWPYRRCPRCSASGRQRAPLSTAYRECGGCGGDGQAIRWGARVMQVLR